MEQTLFDIAPLVKSPLNYTGGKFKLLPQILPLFPERVNKFVDLFAGGCNVGVNANANKVICNDIIPYLVAIFRLFKATPKDEIFSYISCRIAEFSLSASNESAYLALRKEYNRTKHPLDLYILVVYSFNYQIRFNSHHQYNNPFGWANSTFNPVMRTNLEHICPHLRGHYLRQALRRRR